MEIQVSFPGGKRVNAQAGDFTIKTDQSIAAGGQGSAPEPFTLFLASLATCAGIYVASFCQTRGIPTDEIRLVQSFEIDAAGAPTFRIDVQVPESFPAEYRNAVVRAASSCKVKKIIAAAPQFVVTATTIARAAA
jgi:ribosomal protein S12 methylthiotransferase accessory factor